MESIKKVQNGNKITRTFGKMGLKMKKYSPEIFTGLGIVGGIVATVLACKATTKIQDIIDEKNNEMDTIHKFVNDEEHKGRYTEDDAKKDTTIVYTKTAAKILKVYSPSFILGSLSIASIISGQNILRKRNLAIAAAYTAIDEGFKRYRKNVVEKFGDSVDKQLRYNIKAEEIEEEVTDKKGNKKIEKKKVNKMDIAPGQTVVSDYARFFDAANTNEHSKDAEYNLLFLRKMQDYANDTLKHRGYLFLNEVYDMLGMSRTQAGQVVGWIYDENNPVGDNYVDFNIYNAKDCPERINFVNGYDYNILLDFNVDGVIYDKIY